MTMSKGIKRAKDHDDPQQASHKNRKFQSLLLHERSQSEWISPLTLVRDASGGPWRGRRNRDGARGPALDEERTGLLAGVYAV